MLHFYPDKSVFIKKSFFFTFICFIQINIIFVPMNKNFYIWSWRTLLVEAVF